MNALVWGGSTCGVRTATLEVYNQDSPEADWNFEIVCKGPVERVLLSGTATMPFVIGSELEVHHVDDPTDYDAGCLTTSPNTVPLRVIALGEGRARLKGTLALSWNALAADADPSQRHFVVELDVEVELI